MKKRNWVEKRNWAALLSDFIVSGWFVVPVAILVFPMAYYAFEERIYGIILYPWAVLGYCGISAPPLLLICRYFEKREYLPAPRPAAGADSARPKAMGQPEAGSA